MIDLYVIVLCCVNECFFDELSWKEEAAAKNLERVDFWVPSFVCLYHFISRSSEQLVGFY